MYRYKWTYNDNERPNGCCYDCMIKYGEFVDMSIPNDLWEKINPTIHEEAGLLCPTCISNRLHYLGLWYDYNDYIVSFNKNLPNQMQINVN